MAQRTNGVAWGLAAILAVVVLCESLMLIVSRPEKLGFAPGSVKLTQGRLDGDRVVVIDGNSANFLGQIQGIGVDFKGTNIYIQGFVMRLHPFSSLVTHSDWPVLLQERDLSPGRHEVFYWTRERGYLSAVSLLFRPHLLAIRLQPAPERGSDGGSERRWLPSSDCANS